MEFVIVLIIFGASVFFMVRHLGKSFKKGEKCQSCGTKKKGCDKSSH